MTTPLNVEMLNVEMLKELRATLEALTAERTLDAHANRQNSIREEATDAVMYGIRAFCTPVMKCVPSEENAAERQRRQIRRGPNEKMNSGNSESRAD